MILFVVLAVYAFTVLCAARHLYTLKHKGNKILNGCATHEGDAFLLATAAVFWIPVSIGWVLSSGVKKFVTSGARKYDSLKDAAKLEWQEMEQLALRCKDPQEKEIMFSASRSLYEKWRSM